MVNLQGNAVRFTTQGEHALLAARHRMKGVLAFLPIAILPASMRALATVPMLLPILPQGQKDRRSLSTT
jgi:hypothetical protein